MYTYFGGRVGWYHTKRTTKYQDQQDTTSEYESYGVSPIIGLEYQIHEYVFLAIEGGISYTETQSKYNSEFFDPEDVDGSNISTHSNIMLRMMF